MLLPISKVKWECDMLILNVSTLFIIWIGMICTIAPKLHGTVIILTAAAIYAIVMDMSIFQSWIGMLLLILTFIAEVGVQGVRRVLTRDYKVSRQYSTNTFICNLAGIIITSALLGIFSGVVVWEIIIGKTLMARLGIINKILIRLTLTAGVRLLCALFMMIIIAKYMMYII